MKKLTKKQALILALRAYAYECLNLSQMINPNFSDEDVEVYNDQLDLLAEKMLERANKLERSLAKK